MFTIEDTKRRMSAAIDQMKKEFSGLRTGRASTNLLESIQVDAYGSMVPLVQVGSVSVPEPRLLTVSVWDKGVLKNTEKAIRDAGLGLNPQTDGTLIRIPIPPLTEDRRKELAKVAGKYAEQTKISIRNVRRDAMDALKKMEKDGDISEDDHKRQTEIVQKATDDMINQVDALLGEKEKDIMVV